jgi:transcriptional regulator with GAF, ATPase, and Fis domain
MKINIPKTGASNTWYFATSSCDHTLINRILSCLSRQKIISEKWTVSCQPRLGLVFMNGYADYEEIISFLQFQVKGKGIRVCILNLNAAVFETGYKIKILRYGAEYFFERSYLTEPFDALAERLNKWVTIDKLLSSPVIRNRIAGQCVATVTMLRSVIEVAFFSTNNVLILGERGVGKEQIAHIIHDLDTRKDKGDLVMMDCATLKKELSGSELFGHDRGAFTGADYSREGAVALADKGSFFMDEITELPLSLQSEFLRVIQEGTYKKVGSNIWKHSAFRLISATNRDPKKSVTDGEFRHDLLDRIETTGIYVPGLNDRKEDIPDIIDFFMRKNFRDEIPVIEKEVYDLLGRRNYPGNIRELKNILSNIFLKYSGKGPITLGDLPIPDPDESQLPIFDNWFERKEFVEALNNAIDAGYNLKKIEEIIQSMATTITLQRVRKNKEASKILGKSERWIQLQKIKGKNTE